MRARLTGVAVVVALAVPAAVAPAAGAQDPLPTPTASPSPTPTPTATPTPTPTPTPEEQERLERDERDRKAKRVRSIYHDFERDGRIDDCDHTMKALKRARRSIEDSYKEDYPDFRDALNAAIERHRDGKCEEAPVPDEEPDAQPSPGPTGGGTGTSPGTLGGGTTPPPPPPAVTPEQGALPDFGGDNPTDGGGGDKPEPVTPLPGEDAIPEGTASPEATPVPTQAAPVPPKLVVTRAAADPNLFVPGTMLAIALIGLMLAGLSALAARRSERFAGVTQAWREAAWRTSGSWHDFTDWLRVGR